LLPFKQLSFKRRCISPLLRYYCASILAENLEGRVKSKIAARRRVTPSPENIKIGGKGRKYEFLQGTRETGSRSGPGTSGVSDRSLPGMIMQAAWPMTYDASLRRCLICLTPGWPTVRKVDTYVLESGEIAGPWKLVTYMKNFGEQGYFVNIP
jgi:hypothetical protein